MVVALLLVGGQTELVEASPAKGDEGRILTVSLSEGWHLIRMPSDARPISIGAHQGPLRVYGASVLGAPGDGMLLEARSGQLLPGEGYWAYASEVSTLSILGHVGARVTESSSRAQSGWSLFGVDETRPYDGVRFVRLLQWVSATHRYAELRAGDTLEPGIGYWALHDAEGARKPEPPTNLRGTQEGRWVRLVWEARRNGSLPSEQQAGVRYRVHRRDQAGGLFAVVAETEKTHWSEALLDGQHGAYYVTSVRRTDGLEEESGRSPIFEFDPRAFLSPVRAGVFETPNFATEGRESAVLPKVQVVRHAGQVLAHLVYVVPGSGGSPDRIVHRRSTKAGQAGSWGPPTPVGFAGPGRQVLDIAIAARRDRLSVAWISKGSASASGVSQIYVVENETAGVWTDPVEATLVRSNAQWKRGLGLAYDRLGHHHLVWGESNKAYYFKDLQGEYDSNGVLLNVFDEEKRVANPLEVRYARTEARSCPGESTCCSARNEGAYSLALEVKNPVGCATGDEVCALFGPYRHRVEESYVENPSIHVDDQRITIIAHQTRMYDNFSYPNPEWRGRRELFLGPMVPSARPDPQAPPPWCSIAVTEFQQGFRQAWKADQYACPPIVPSNVADLVRFDSDPEKTQGWARGDFYAYDGTRGHPRDWYQFEFNGRWHEEDVIKVAQRPLVAGSWSETRVERHLVPQVVDSQVVLGEVVEPVELGFRQDTWQRSSLDAQRLMADGSGFEETLTRWRISTVDRFDALRGGEFQRCGKDSPSESSGSFGPVRATLSGGPRGQLMAVYEKGQSSSPNDLDANAILFSLSSDGGRHWSEPKELARGYMPVGAISSRGRIGVLYYAPTSAEHPQGSIRLAQRASDAGFEEVVLNEHPAKAIHFTTHGSGAGRLLGVPQWVAFEELRLAVWVGPGIDVFEQDRVVVARAREANDVRQLSVEVGPLVEGQAGVVTVRLEDKFHFRVDEDHEVEVSAASVSSAPSPARDDVVEVSPGRAPNEMGQPSSGGSAAGEVGLVSSVGISSLEPGYAQGGPVHGAVSSPYAVDERNGFEGHLALVQGQATIQFTAALASDAGAVGETVFRLRSKEEGAEDLAIELKAPVVSAGAHGNALTARMLRNQQIREETGGLAHAPRMYQVEYQPDAKLAASDSKHLAAAERVWVYTQGIALAQYARSVHAQERGWAQGIARWLCHHAQTGAAEDGSQRSVIKGWHFSHNTKNDSWRDARLVTGANAWVVHGLSSFLVSLAYDELSAQEQGTLKSCYLRGVRGLAEHQRVFADGTSLMTAGWTTLGLVHAGSPKALSLSIPAYPDDAEERWEYYDVLDALGYDRFPEDESKRPQIRTYKVSPGAAAAKAYGRILTVSEEDWRHLKHRVKANNVVTEHNLDVLAVLNHALDHHVDLGPEETAENAEWTAQVRVWRNSLRDGVFQKLWDDKTWRADLTEGQVAMGADLGRIVTGGSFVGGAEVDQGVLHSDDFLPSPHVAIDNCSWLSLSVQLDSLSDEHQEKLAKCLHYTLLVFAKDLPFEKKVYYGTHYFKNSFRDPYIEESPLQESSYHLEATAGLILGLVRFSEVHVDHASSAHFRKQAHKLWSSMQRYVSEWGFPYSSQRIHNLSTLLASSTAIIWFIDVYDALNGSVLGDRAAVETLERSDEGLFLPDELASAPFVDRLEVGYAEKDVPFEDVAGALLELSELMRSPGHSGIPQDTLHQFGLKVVAVRGKMVTTFGQRAVRAIDELIQLPPGLLLTSMVGANSAAYLGASAEVDLSLETILVGSEVPSVDVWERLGVVPSEEVVVQPMGSFFRPEEEIRKTGLIYPEGPILGNPLKNPPLLFEDERIYFIDMEWLGVETPVGKLGFLTPGSASLWPVYALRADRPRAEILEDFIRNHIFYQQVAPEAEDWPEALRTAWLYLVELAIRADFGRAAAERYGVGASPGAGPEGDDSVPDVHSPPKNEGEKGTPDSSVHLGENPSGSSAGVLEPLSLILTSNTVYRGIPYEALRGGIRGAPEQVYWVLPADRNPKSPVEEYEPILATKVRPRGVVDNPELGAALVNGRAWVLVIASPPGSMDVESAYHALGITPPGVVESMVMVPFLTTQYVHSRYQVDAQGKMIEGTLEINQDYEPMVRAPGQGPTRTWVDISPINDDMLAESLVELPRRLEGASESSEEWSLEALDRARLSVPTVLVTARTAPPFGPEGVFKTKILPESHSGASSAFVYAFAFKGALQARLSESAPPRSGEVVWMYYIENNGAALNHGLQQETPNGEYAFLNAVKPEQIMGAQELRWDAVQKKWHEGPFLSNSEHRVVSLPNGNLVIKDGPAEVVQTPPIGVPDSNVLRGRLADPLLKDLRWAFWLFQHSPAETDAKRPKVGSEEEKSFSEFVRSHTHREGGSLIPWLISAEINNSSYGLELPAMPHHPVNQKIFRRFALDLFRRQFPQEQGWDAPREKVVDRWLSSYGHEIVLSYEIRVTHRDGTVVSAVWDPKWIHRNRVREWGPDLVKFVDESVEAKVLSDGRLALPSDVFLIEEYYPMHDFLLFSSGAKVARVWLGESLENPDDYPLGIAEVPVQSILRTAPARVAGTGSDKLFFDMVRSVLNNGFFLAYPIQVEKLEGGELVLKAKGHRTVAMFNGLGEGTAPVQFHAKGNGPVTSGPNSAPAWVLDYANSGESGPVVDAFQRTKSIPAPTNVSFGAPNKTNQPKLHLSYDDSPFLHSVALTAFHWEGPIQSLRDEQRGKLGTTGNGDRIVFSTVIPKKSLPALQEKGFPIDALLGQSHDASRYGPIPGKKLYFTARQIWQEEGRPILGLPTEMFEYTPVVDDDNSVTVFGELWVELLDATRAKVDLRTRFNMTKEHFEHRHQMTPQRAFVYVYRANLANGFPEVVFVREHKDFDTTARWNDDRWDQQTIRSLVDGLNETNGIFVSIKVKDEEKGVTIHGKEYRMPFDPKWIESISFD